MELAGSPMAGVNDKSQLGSDCALKAPSPLQLAVIGPGVPLIVGVGVGVGIGVGVALCCEGDDPPPPHPTRICPPINAAAINLTPVKLIIVLRNA